jgi:hypothetical protein
MTNLLYLTIMSRFSIPEPHKPRVDPSEFDDPFFTDNKKPNVYMELGEELQEEGSKQIIGPQLNLVECTEVLTNISQRLEKDPNSSLTQEEASLVYQVDQDLPEIQHKTPSIKHLLPLTAKLIKTVRGFYDDMPDAEIRQLQDYEQVKSLIIERLRSEKYVHQTYEALSQVVEGLVLDPQEYTQEMFMQTLIEKMNEWQERGVFDYLTIELIKNGSRYNLVPTPNKYITSSRLHHLALKLHAFSTGFDHDLLDKYSTQELSGYQPDKPKLRLSLIPTHRFDTEDHTVEEQNALLEELKNDHPELSLHIPSVFDAMCYWYVYAQIVNNQQYAENMIQDTRIRHIDLPAKKIQGLSGRYVPVTDISGSGVSVNHSSTISNFPAKAAIG